MVSRVRFESFAGGETRLSWCTLPSPRDPARSSRHPAMLVAGESVLADGDAVPPPNLVNGSESEEAFTAGVSGFGAIPGKTVFGLNARRSVKRLAATIDEISESPGDVIFFTGTLPGSTRSAVLALSQWSGFMVHRLKSWMHDIDPGYFGLSVWEWQQRGALHIHLAVYVKDVARRNSIYNGLRNRWIDLLFQISDLSGCDLFARAGGRGSWRNCLDKVRAEAEWVKKGVGPYLGKYMSKAVKPGQESSRYFYPSRWWATTSSLRKEEVGRRNQIEHFYSLPGQAEAAYNKVSGLQPLLSEWSVEYGHKFGSGSTVVAANSSVPLLTKFISRGLRVVATSHQLKIAPLMVEFREVFLQLQIEDSDWFAGFCASVPPAYKLLQYFVGSDLVLHEGPDESAMLVMAVSHLLSHSATGGQFFRGRRLHPREVIRIRNLDRRLKSAMDDYLEYRYDCDLKHT